MAWQNKMMWSTESAFNYLEYSRLSPSPSGASSSTVLSTGSPSYHKDDDIRDALSRGPAPLKAIYVAVVESDGDPQCLMKQDDWDALTAHFGVDHGFVDACMGNGLASEGKGDSNMRDGKVSFWNISKVARFDPAAYETSYIQFGVHVTFDVTTRSTILIAVLKGKNPVAIPCWHNPQPADDPFEVMGPMFKSVMQSWAMYFWTQDRDLSALEEAAATHPETFHVWRALANGPTYTKCRAELKILKRTLKFMRAKHEEYAGLKPANPATKEMLRSYISQAKKLVDRADYLLERVGTLKSMTFFSMGFFNSLGGKRAWLFPTIAIPITIFTISIWFVWQRNRYKTDPTQTYGVATSSTHSFSGPTKRLQYDSSSRNITQVHQQTQAAKDNAVSTFKATESQPQIHHLGVPGAESSATATYFTGSSSVTLTKAQSPREEKTDLVSSGSDSIITVRPANFSPSQSSRTFAHSPDLPNLEKVMSSTSTTPTATSTIPPPPERRRTPTPPPQKERRSTPTPPPQNPAITRVSQDLKRSGAYQQGNRPSAEVVRKSVDQNSTAGSDWFTS
ncbi:hypothetical protein FGG08_007289 [Glutinoglossum americanum]|uniref:Uncharacterized protein n=1 Tax=Glutinoglossum americanum TaxID=1670608 RepID=A0A9P8HZN5_9PEZI|nr:hypothetical protein FGG08_007289 [Glutinoglossum americanum]